MYIMYCHSGKIISTLVYFSYNLNDNSFLIHFGEKGV